MAKFSKEQRIVAIQELLSGKGMEYMTNTTITNLRKHLYAYVNQAVTYNDPVNIVTKDGNAVLLSENEYRGMLATMGLMGNAQLARALDTMVKWFCILFGNQFHPDHIYDHYPANRLMHDIALAIMAVQTQTTEVLDSFPTKSVTQEAEELMEELPTEP